MKQVILILIMGLSISGWCQKEERSKGFSRDRLFFGGDITAVITESVTALGASPFAGYRLTERLSAGVGITYLYYSTHYATPPNFKTSIYGGNIFSRLILFSELFQDEDIFLQSEFHILNTGVFLFNPSTEQFEIYRKTVPLLYIGGGFRIPVGGNAYASLTAMWDIIEDPNSPYQNPIIRGGIIIGL